MKLVRENINEKFTEGSDPIKDMGIGWPKELKKLFKYVEEHYAVKPRNSGELLEELCRLLSNTKHRINKIKGEQEYIENSIRSILENEKITPRMIDLALIRLMYEPDKSLINLFLEHDANPAANQSKSLAVYVDYTTLNKREIDYEIIELLIKHGANPEDQDGVAMRKAIERKYYDLTEYFLNIIKQKIVK